MKLPLQLVASILLTSAYASVWPYHGAVGPSAVFVAPTYAVAPALTLLASLPTREASTVLSTSNSNVQIHQSTAATSSLEISKEEKPIVSENVSLSTKEPTIATGPSIGPVLVKGASTGPVTLIAPSDGPVVEARTNDAAGAIVTDSGKGGTVTITQETIEASSNGTSSSSGSSTGVASATAVVGPSVGPIVVAGPTAPPVLVAAPAALPSVDEGSTTSSSVVSTSNISTGKTAFNAITSASATATATASASFSSTVSNSKNDGAGSGSTVIESSASSSSRVTNNSENSSATSAAGVNLITSGRAIAIAGVPQSNIVVSAPTTLVSGPSGSISTVGSPELFLKKTPNPILHDW